MQEMEAITLGENTQRITKEEASKETRMNHQRVRASRGTHAWAPHGAFAGAYSDQPQKASTLRQGARALVAFKTTPLNKPFLKRVKSKCSRWGFSDMAYFESLSKPFCFPCSVQNDWSRRGRSSNECTIFWTCAVFHSAASRW